MIAQPHRSTSGPVDQDMILLLLGSIIEKKTISVFGGEHGETEHSLSGQRFGYCSVVNASEMSHRELIERTALSISTASGSSDPNKDSISRRCWMPTVKNGKPRLYASLAEMRISCFDELETGPSI